MPAVVNSQVITIVSGDDNVEVGWSIRVLDYKDMTTLVAVVSEYTEFSFTQELNAPGEGSITIDDDSPFWGTVLENDLNRRTLQNRVYVFEAWDRDTPRFAWLGQTVTNTVIGEDETKAVIISGPGIASVLSYAPIGRPGWPTKVPIIGHKQSQADPSKQIPIYRATASTDTLPAYNWQFPMKWPTMRMWHTVFKAAQRRGLVPWVKPTFTATKDSAGRDFQWVKTIEAIATKEGYQPTERNQTLLDFLDDCTGQDYSKWFGQRLEWLMHPGFKLDVRRRIGADRTNYVRFFQGSVLSVERTREREGIYNRVIAQDVIGNESIRTDSSSIARWNLREQWNTTHKNVTVDDLRNQIADRLIQQSKAEKDQWTIKVSYNDSGRVPYRHYFVGDHVGFNVDDQGMTPNAIDPPDKMRVMAITIKVSAEDSLPEAELTLQSIIDTRLAELEKQITQLLNNPRNIDLNEIKQINIPEEPTTGSTMVYNPDTGKWEAVPFTAGGGGGNRVFIGPTDPALVPANGVTAGDFWYQRAI